MSDVPDQLQGTQARAARGKQLHDRVVDGKSVSPEGAESYLANGQKRNAFVHGAKKTSGVFHQNPYQGDNFENKKLMRRVGSGLIRKTKVRREERFILELSR